jgi:hypothetical protein
MPWPSRSTASQASRGTARRGRGGAGLARGAFSGAGWTQIPQRGDCARKGLLVGRTAARRPSRLITSGNNAPVHHANSF